MTEDELKQKEEELTAREQKLAEQEKQQATTLTDVMNKVQELTAQVKSFEDENKELKTKNEKAEKDLIETKALNLRLARQQDSKPHQTAEEILYNMFFPKK